MKHPFREQNVQGKREKTFQYKYWRILVVLSQKNITLQKSVLFDKF